MRWQAVEMTLRHANQFNRLVEFADNISNIYILILEAKWYMYTVQGATGATAKLYPL